LEVDKEVVGMLIIMYLTFSNCNSEAPRGHGGFYMVLLKALFYEDALEKPIVIG
jgi:hypothetical protein